MPIYEYACEKCGREFDAEQRITDDPVKSCPHCRSRRVKRLISQTSFVLKGGGWHADLYSSGGKAKKKDEAGGDAATSESAAADSGGSDSKAKPDEKAKVKDKGKGSAKKKGPKAAA